jgi:pyruvate dehydrogenase E2 component (dihydrolipoamide acetyltransferase)
MSQNAEQILEGTTTPLSKIRRIAARRMVEAWAAPVFHLTCEADMTRALEARDRTNGVTVTDVLLRACADALAEHPDVNAHFGDDAVTTFERVNLGLAVATDAGLTVPVIHDADRLDLVELARRRREIVEKARLGTLRTRDVDGGTFTVSNLGMFGVDYFDAVLNPPQVAILAVGATRQRYVMVGDEPAWRPIADLTLTCDHRAVDGAAGARFLATLRRVLEGTAIETELRQ